MTLGSVDTARRLAGRGLYTLGSAAATAGGLLGKGIAASVRALAPTSDKETILHVSFSSVTWDGHDTDVLLLGYESGFQVWLVGGDGPPQELASRREGPSR